MKIVYSLLGIFIISIVVMGAAVELILSLGETFIFMCFSVPILYLTIFFSVNMVTRVRESNFKKSLLKPNERGVYPIPLNNAKVAGMVYEIALSFHDSQHIHVPHTFTYSPRLSTKNEGVEQQNVSRETLPSFDNLPFKDGHLFIGYDREHPFYTPIDKTLSTLIVGASGSGKTTLTRLLAYQYHQQGVKISIIDPHAKAGNESLLGSLEPFSFASGDDINILKMYEKMIKLRLNGDPDRTPHILFIDEFTELMNSEYSHLVESVVMTISNRARKVGIYCMALGQQFRKTSLSTELRNSFTNHIGLYGRKDNAEIASGNSEFARLVGQIKGYQCVFSSIHETKLIDFPNTKEEDLKRRIGFKTDSTPVRVLTTEPIKNGQDEPTLNPSGTQLDPEETAIISLFRSGMKPNEIAKEMYGIEKSGGAMQKANEKIYDALRKGL